MLTRTTKMIMMTVTAFAAGFAALPASAGAPGAVSLKIDRTDLMSDTGMQRIYYRLKQTAEKACQADDGRISLPQKLASERCAAQLMDGFVVQLNNQRMSAFHRDARKLAG